MQGFDLEVPRVEVCVVGVAGLEVVVWFVVWVGGAGVDVVGVGVGVGAGEGEGGEEG